MKCCRRVGIEFSFFILFEFYFFWWVGEGGVVVFAWANLIPNFFEFLCLHFEIWVKRFQREILLLGWWFWCLWFWKLSAWIRVLVFFSFHFNSWVGLLSSDLVTPIWDFGHRFGNPIRSFVWDWLHLYLATEFEVLFEDCTQIWQSNSKFCLKVAHRFGNLIQSFVRDCAQIWRPNSKFCSRLHADLVTRFEVLLFLFEWNWMEFVWWSSRRRRQQKSFVFWGRICKNLLWVVEVQKSLWVVEECEESANICCGCRRKCKKLCGLWKNVKKVQKSVVGCGRTWRKRKNLLCDVEECAKICCGLWKNEQKSLVGRGRMSSDRGVFVFLAENKIGQELSKKSNPLLGSRDF